jgi:hypothetical protein
MLMRKSVFLTMAVPFCLSLSNAQASEKPAIVKNWIHNEQHVNYRGEGNQNGAMKEVYTPEAGEVFALKGYWVNTADVDYIFDQASAPAFLKSTFFRIHNGRQQILFPVHPQVTEYYSDFLKDRPDVAPFESTPSASIRSLFTWDPQTPQNVFFAKLSIDLVLGANRRLIPAEELARSIYFTQLFGLIKKDLPATFTYLPESLAIMPKGMSEGGVLVRGIPKEVLNGEKQIVPFFSLYNSDPLDPEKKAPLVRIMEKSGAPGRAFVRGLLASFAKEWLDLAIDQGITSEPHGQNLAAELTKDGRLTGRFVHRDFGGFSADRKFRQEMGLPDIQNMPKINGISSSGDNDYGIKASLSRFFVTILDSIDWRYSEWQRKGWVDAMGPETFRETFIKDLQKLYTEKTGLPMDIHSDFTKVLEFVLKAKEKKVAEHQARMTFTADRAPMCKALF